MNLPRARTILLAILTSIAATWFLRETFVVTMPLAAAMFIAAVMWPVYRWLVRHVRWFALPISMLLVALVTVLFFGAIATAVAFAIDRMPQYVEAAKSLWQQVSDRAQAAGLPADQLALTKSDGSLPDWVRSYMTWGLATLWSLCGYMVLIFFFTAMMLSEGRRWSQKTRAALDNDRAWNVIDAVDAISGKVRAYLLTQTFISMTSGILEGTYLWLIGVPLAGVWGLLFFILNYIPNVGSVIALLPPVLITLATRGPWWAAAVVGGIMVLETLIGYVLQPIWQGKSLSISPLVVLLSVVFWGWVWGVVGAVLAVPLTATILIAFAHVDSLKPIALLLSSSPSRRELKKQTTAPAA